MTDWVCVFMTLTGILLAECALADPTTINASCGSIVIGGAALGNSIVTRNDVCGVPPEILVALIHNKTRDLQELSSTQQALIDRLRTDLDLNQRQVRSALAIVGEANVPLEQIAAKLLEVAERYKALKIESATQAGETSEVLELKASAQTAIEAYDLAKADRLYAEIDASQAKVLDRIALNSAEISAKRGDFALARLRYSEAAKYFAMAIERLGGGHDTLRSDYLKLEAFALYQIGFGSGDNTAAKALSNA